MNLCATASGGEPAGGREPGSAAVHVFTSLLGTALDAANVRRALRRAARAAGLDPKRWTPRELRDRFVSIASALGLTLEPIADLVGHVGTRVTDAVYRRRLGPRVMSGQPERNKVFELHE
ncbi:hypothetical protein [Dactylosporangium sp. NPDC051541]|uniref:hypothetical protein n=1 Tax=Dactylosporangium sp. NPDC051541 TaxID=3363977 RepID=UPI003789BA13